MFYETAHSLDAFSLRTGEGEDFTFPAHLHGAFELITVTEGEMRVTVDGRDYEVTPGNAVLVFPEQLHALATPRHARHKLWIFSPKCVQGYARVYSHLLPESNRFPLSEDLEKRLFALKESDAEIRVKGVLYTVCADFDAGAVYKERGAERENLLYRTFAFVRDKYAEDCSLSALAAATGYTYVYLSKYFKERTGVSFTEYVARYRINESIYLLENTSDTILSIALAAGFQTLRSYNRTFREVTGTTPSAYRRSKERKTGEQEKSANK